MAYEWQQQGTDSWLYGDKVRGVVRDARAKVSWRPGQPPVSFGEHWYWQAILPEGTEESGRCVSLGEGVKIVEDKLQAAGLLDDTSPV